MSLINKMLIDLEERQACLAGEQDIALQGISSVNDAAFHKSNDRKLRNYLLGLGSVILFVSLVLILNQYQHGGEPRALSDNIVNSEQAEIRIVEAPTSPSPGKIIVSEIPARSTALSDFSDNSNDVSLKLDTMFSSPSVQKLAQAEVLPTTPAIESKTVPAPAGPTALSISDLRLESYQNRTLFRVLLSGKPDFAVYALPKPDRVVVEINNIEEKTTLPWIGSSELVEAVRARYQGKSRALIVLDMMNPSSVIDSEVIASSSGYEMVITIISDIPAQTVATLEPSDQELDRQLREYGLVNDTVTDSQPAVDNSRMIKRTRKAADYYKDGLQIYRAGNSTEAAALFYDALSLEPGHMDSRSVLVSLMMEEGNRYQAGELLKGGLSLHPGQADWAVTYAHILVEQGRLDAAVETLQKQPPKLGDHLEYHAFLAALLQQQGKHEASVDLYRRLLDRKAKNGVWWMGLGISLEALAQVNDADYAYRKALRDPALSSELRNYIAKQIAQL